MASKTTRPPSLFVFWPGECMECISFQAILCYKVYSRVTRLGGGVRGVKMCWIQIKMGPLVP